MGNWIYKSKIINDINDFKPETFGLAPFYNKNLSTSKLLN